MSTIRGFIERYQREVDFYQQVARLVAQQLESRLQSAGIRAIVTFRAKRVDSLEAKLHRRASARAYDSEAAIASDIVDLAGVRVALYFPGDRPEVDKHIRTQFDLTTDPKTFPTGEPAAYQKRFAGYHATHYRAKLREASVPASDSRYSTAGVEIQVGSVLMHAWAEVEHDLVYKPTAGPLSDDEYAILDELNGMVLAGEIALERLQRAVRYRVSTPEADFRNHYDLAAYLYDAARLQQLGPEEPAMGSADVLFVLLQEAGLTKPSQLEPYISSLREATEERPLAEQIIDLLVSSKPDLYPRYSELRSDWRDGRTSLTLITQSEELAAAVGVFLNAWIQLERTVRDKAGSRAAPGPIPFSRLARMVEFSPKDRYDLRELQQLRNQVVHGFDIPPSEFLRQAAGRLNRLQKKLARRK